MPNEQHLLKVFLCHASADKPRIRELYRYLRRRGIKPWFDEVNLVGGQDWQVEIPKALATSDAIIVCLTKNSVDKEGYIQKEIKFALDKALEMPEGKIFLIPVRFEECEVPFSLSRYQWVDLFDEAGYTRMMRALKFRAAQLERATVQLTKKDVTEEKFMPGRVDPEKQEHKAVEKAERRTTQHIALKGPLSKFFNSLKSVLPKAKRFLRIGGVIGILLLLIWAGSWIMPQIRALVPTEKASTPSPNSTIAFSTSTIPFTKTITPRVVPTRTRLPTPTPRAIMGDTFAEIALLGKIIPSEYEEFTCADISPDGQIIAIGSYNRNDETSSVQLWRTDDTTLLETLPTQDRYITNILFSPDGILLASGADNGTLRVWTVKTREKFAPMNDTDKYIQKIGFSKDGRKLAASTSSRIEVWNIDTGKLSSAINVAPVITSLVVGPNNKIAYTTRDDYISDWYYPPDPIHKKPLKTPVPIWNTIYTTNYGNLDDLQHTQQLSVAGFVEVLDFSQDGEMLLGKSWNWGGIPILNLTNNEVESFSYNYGDNQRIFLPDNNGIIVASYDNLSLLRISDGDIQTISNDHNNYGANLAFSRNGWVLISSNGKSVNIWGIPRWNSTPTPTLAPPTAIK